MNIMYIFSLVCPKPGFPNFGNANTFLIVWKLPYAWFNNYQHHCSLPMNGLTLTSTNTAASPVEAALTSNLNGGYCNRWKSLRLGASAWELSDPGHGGSLKWHSVDSAFIILDVQMTEFSQECSQITWKYEHLSHRHNAVFRAPFPLSLQWVVCVLHFSKC